MEPDVRIDSEELIAARLVWTQVSRKPFPWKTTFKSHALELHAGDWPIEATLLVYVNGRKVLELMGWPKAWVKPP